MEDRIVQMYMKSMRNETNPYTKFHMLIYSQIPENRTASRGKRAAIGEASLSQQI